MKFMLSLNNKPYNICWADAKSFEESVKKAASQIEESPFMKRTENASAEQYFQVAMLCHLPCESGTFSSVQYPLFFLWSSLLCIAVGGAGFPPHWPWLQGCPWNDGLEFYNAEKVLELFVEIWDEGLEKFGSWLEPVRRLMEAD